MFGLVSRPTAGVSRSERAAASTWRSAAARRSFTPTIREVPRSWASHTSPIPPEPTRRRSSYRSDRTGAVMVATPVGDPVGLTHHGRRARARKANVTPVAPVAAYRTITGRSVAGELDLARLLQFVRSQHVQRHHTAGQAGERRRPIELLGDRGLRGLHGDAARLRVRGVVAADPLVVDL